MRGSNQIAVLRELNEKKATPEFISAVQFVLAELPQRMAGTAYRHQIAHAAARTEENYRSISQVIVVGNYYEETGILGKSGLVDCDLMLNMLSGSIVEMWEALRDVTALLRETHGPSVWENFEYVTVLSQDWIAKHAEGTYPKNVRRLDVTNRWPHTEGRNAASTA